MRFGARLGATAAAAYLAGCSSSGSGAPDAASDQSSVDGTTGDEILAESGPGEATRNAPTSPEASPDAGADADADAAPVDGSGGSADSGDSSAACVPVDASFDADTAEAGLDLVQNYYCLDCHGTDLSGGLPISGAHSKNLTPDPATGLGCWTDPQIVTAMLYGTTPDGETLCVMPRWGTTGYNHRTLDADQAETIVNYLRSIPAVSHVVQPTDCVALGFGPDAGSDAAVDAGDAASDAAGDAAVDLGDGGDGATE